MWFTAIFLIKHLEAFADVIVELTIHIHKIGVLLWWAVILLEGVEIKHARISQEASGGIVFELMFELHFEVFIERKVEWIHVFVHFFIIWCHIRVLFLRILPSFLLLAILEFVQFFQSFFIPEMRVIACGVHDPYAFHPLDLLEELLMMASTLAWCLRADIFGHKNEDFGHSFAARVVENISVHLDELFI